MSSKNKLKFEEINEIDKNLYKAKQKVYQKGKN